jgi:hypothetical protein
MTLAIHARPIPLKRVLTSTEGYTYDTKVWAVSIGQGKSNAQALVRFVRFVATNKSLDDAAPTPTTNAAQTRLGPVRLSKGFSLGLIRVLKSECETRQTQPLNRVWTEPSADGGMGGAVACGAGDAVCAARG